MLIQKHVKDKNALGFFAFFFSFLKHYSSNYLLVITKEIQMVEEECVFC